MTAPSKRDRLVDSAAELFHHFGFLSTSLADIAKHAEIPIGNVYYYFKTKEDLASAALEKRRGSFNEIFRQLDAAFDDPRERLIEMVRCYERVKDDYTRYGCPIGRMIVEGEGSNDHVVKSATQIFTELLDWAQAQFRSLGHGEDARRHANALLAHIQGSILFAKAYNKPEFITDAIERLVGWLESLPNKRVALGKVGMKAFESAN